MDVPSGHGDVVLFNASLSSSTSLSTASVSLRVRCHTIITVSGRAKFIGRYPPRLPAVAFVIPRLNQWNYESSSSVSVVPREGPKDNSGTDASDMGRGRENWGC